ncbi:RNA polymerase factor sigma-54 [Virgibacillus sp. DJP39]|uniref:RNA polymerase factor sigma-54 n=1 Tax=Virgibacillus sp. DJP39 TaxID=3409790 RepID=UPI003BB4F7CA
MEIVLQQRQTLDLVMTTELKQAIALLQYSTYELYQFIQEQQLENPLIELEDKKEASDKGEFIDGRKSGTSSSVDPFDFISSDEKCMRSDLVEQTKWLDIKEHEKSVLQYLIYSLDEHGYLPLSDAEIASYLELTVVEVTRSISILQQMDPVGLGARDLRECLLLQIKYYYPDEQVAEHVVRDHLDLLANKKWHVIAKTLGITLEEIKTAYDLIKTLNPKPCSLLSSESTEYLNPDVIVDNIEGKFVVYMNDGYLPEVHFNNQYSNKLNNKDELGKYVQDKFRNYQWLVNSIEQRKQTILKITHAILQKQQGFFLCGFSELKPLTLKEIAKEINMHESTVSRATANKVIQTPNGSFEFRIFFTSKLRTKDGDSTSQTKVKLLLEDFVRQENKFKPASDQKIADYFKTTKGITISRRTVAKYREQLKIPPTSKRKEFEIK